MAGRRSRPTPPGRLRRCPLDGWREGQSRPKYLSPRLQRPPPPLLLPHGSVRERNFLLRRPLRSPGVCRGRGGAPAAPAPRLLLLAAAGSVNPGVCCRTEAAADPAAPGCRGRAPAPPRRGKKPSHGPPRSESPGRAPFHSSLSSGKTSGPGRGCGRASGGRRSARSPSCRWPWGPSPRCLGSRGCSLWRRAEPPR